MKKNIKISKEKMNSLKNELKKLKKKQKSLNKAWELAVKEGDDRETDALFVTKDLLEDNERDMIKLSNLIYDADVVDHKKECEEVGIGCEVIVEINGDKQSIHIVDPIEADPRRNKFSTESPLGKSLLGLKVGEQTSYTLPSGAKNSVIILSLR